MNAQKNATAAPTDSSMWRSLAARIALIAAVVALPIAALSFVLIAHNGHAIAAARAERATLVEYRRIPALSEKVAALQAREPSDAAGAARARADVQADLAAAQRAFAHPVSFAPAGVQAEVESRWRRVRSAPAVGDLQAVLDGLGEVEDALEDSAPLDVDLDATVKDLSAVILRYEPRSIASLRGTAAAVAASGGRRLDLRTAENIARQRAREDQALTLSAGGIADALAREPRLALQLKPFVDAASTASAVYDARVDVLLANGSGAPGDVAAIASAARAASDAHSKLSEAARNACEDFVARKLARQLARRNVTIALAVPAMLAGMLIIAGVSRYEARRDRIALAASKFEAAKLRADLTALSAERALRLQEARFKTVFENADLGIVTFDPENGKLEHNSAVTRMLANATAAVLANLMPAIRQFALTEHEPFRRDECRSSGDDSPQWLTFTFSGVYEEGACRLVIVLVRDTTEERLAAQALAYDAHHDGLTGLANRIAFEAALRDELRPGRPFTPLALMYLDLDKFKPVNDTFGHEAGDRVLVAVAERLRSVVGATDLCARIGGDEFAIILRGVDDARTVDHIAQRVGAAIAAPVPYDDAIELDVTSSIGITLAASRERSADELKRDADAALYAVKRAGRGGYRVFERLAAEPVM